jgi:uncharacterized protein (TIGR03435 family)
MNVGTQSIAQLAVMLSNALRRPVIDRTGLTGNFSATLTWTPDTPSQNADAPPVDPNGPALFTAIQEQLGLKLESSRDPVSVLVIDHLEKPTPD